MSFPTPERIEEWGKEEESDEIQDSKFKGICRFYSTAKGCMKGDSCDFKHLNNALEYQRQQKNLHKCPNAWCSNNCYGRQCRACHFQLQRRQRGRGGHHDNRRLYARRNRRRNNQPYSQLKLCPTDGCRNICRGRRCKECHFKYQPRIYQSESDREEEQPQDDVITYKDVLLKREDGEEEEEKKRTIVDEIMEEESD